MELEDHHPRRVLLSRDGHKVAKSSLGTAQGAPDMLGMVQKRELQQRAGDSSEG